MNKRENWIDIIKGLGIVCVVAGHTLVGTISEAIYIFHMPLFFFISGYLYKRRDNFRQYFNDKLIYLIIPYFAFLLLIYLPFSIPVIAKSEYSKKVILRALLEITVGGRALSGPVTVFWFITCLFLVQQVFNYIIVKYNSKTLFRIVIFMLLLSYINSCFFPSFWLPWNANVVLAALPIFYIGNMYRETGFKEKFFLILTISLIAIFSRPYLQSNTYNMKSSYYGIPIITLICSICLILLTKRLSLAITGVTKIAVVFIELGKASMIIMYLHQPFQIIVKEHIVNSGILALFLSILASYLMYLFISRISFLRAFLLGSKNDFQKMGLFVSK